MRWGSGLIEMNGVQPTSDGVSCLRQMSHWCPVFAVFAEASLDSIMVPEMLRIDSPHWTHKKYSRSGHPSVVGTLGIPANHFSRFIVHAKLSA